METKVFDYDLAQFNFTAILENMLQTDDLSALEAETGSGKDTYSFYKNMEQTIAYKRLYEVLDSERGKVFYDTYEQFVKDVIQPQYDEPIYYQKKPTHRLLYHNVEGVSRFHRDSDYGHNPAEINYFVPQTEAFDSNTLWIESEIGKKDFEPVNLKPGQFVRFKGVNLEHGAKNNTTEKTRVSFDFRVIPASQFPEQVTDISNWKEEDKQNALFQNAHKFTLCK
ncbi:MAG: hypothetical protein WBG71_16170 [Leeuwenhoekiella sp.]